MAASPEPRWTLDELYQLVREHEAAQQARHYTIKVGLALVFSVLLPGLGLLFLRRVGWALAYSPAFGFFAWLLLSGHLHHPLMKAVPAAIYLMSIFHTWIAADVSDD